MQVWDNEGVILIPDHYIFTEDPRANRNVDLLREYATRYNIKHFYDITDRSDFQANPDYKGVCHVALAQVRTRCCSVLQHARCQLARCRRVVPSREQTAGFVQLMEGPATCGRWPCARNNKGI